jgi:hypothetical protein
MQARKQMRKYVNRMRRKMGKRNGVIHCCAFDFGSRGPWTDKRTKRQRYPRSDVSQ